MWPFAFFADEQAAKSIHAATWTFSGTPRPRIWPSCTSKLPVHLLSPLLTLRGRCECRVQIYEGIDVAVCVCVCVCVRVFVYPHKKLPLGDVKPKSVNFL